MMIEALGRAESLKQDLVQFGSISRISKLEKLREM